MPTLIDNITNPNPVARCRPTDAPGFSRQDDFGQGDARNSSRGGVAPKPEVLSRPGWQGVMEGSSIDRAPGNTNDTLITRTRGLLYRRAFYITPATASGNLNWTAAGPAKDMPTTRFGRNTRPIVGGSHADMWGQHTNPTGTRANALTGKPRMRAAKQNRLTVQRYRGQSYSQTTELAGA